MKSWLDLIYPLMYLFVGVVGNKLLFNDAFYPMKRIFNSIQNVFRSIFK